MAACAPARLVYFERWTDPIADEILAGRPDLERVQLKLAGDVRDSWSQLERAHGYQAVTRTEAAHAAAGAQWLPGAALVRRCPSLLAICTPGAGYDVVDVAACSDAGVIVCNNSGPGAEAVAEHALAFMLVLAKKIALADRALRRAPVADRTVFRGSELRGKTLGIVGLGRIGARLVELCRPFAMTVLAHDPPLGPEQIAARGAEPAELDALLARADFVVLTCPLTAQTRGIFGPGAFARMKPGAYFVTTARGEVHDEAALLAALESGRLGGAGIDVFHAEPPPPDHPLLALENVVATPHVAGITVEATRELARAAAEQWLAIFDGQVPPGLVNPQAWPRYAERFERLLGRRPAELE